MKTITHFESIDFLKFIAADIEMVQEGERINYQHTHDRVHYDPETGDLNVEAICKNQDGAAFGLNQYGYAKIPIEWNQFLPDDLLHTPNWMDI